MPSGTLFLVVGPSGVGKDTLLKGARAALAGDERFVFARRSITRPAEADGEDHEPLTPDEFAHRRRTGGFWFTWTAHGLDYGLPGDIADLLAQGRHVVANGSRATVADLAARYRTLVIVEVSAPPDLVAQRLKSRGRELAEQVARRLARSAPSLPPHLDIIRVVNDADLSIGTERLVEALTGSKGPALRLRALPIDTWNSHLAYLPVGSPLLSAVNGCESRRVEISGEGRSILAEVHVIDDSTMLDPSQIGLSRRAFEALGLPDGAKISVELMAYPESVAALRAKLRGEELSDGQICRLIGDIIKGRYPDREITAFLVAASRGLTDREVVALARARAEFTEKIHWDENIIVDKHSMGGILGNRISMILVPLVAAHGMAMPKTSSRAITSAAGTADAMETVARVDLTVGDVRRVVAQARGCIAWNGRLNHSVVDDVMNGITRPLGLNSTRWSVASILSKKLSAGSTHVIIDLPYGPEAKLKTRLEAEELSSLFVRIGHDLGLAVEAIPTDGAQPIGRGIGSSLEVRDVFLVLDNDASAPSDLREKALFFGSRILSWDPCMGSNDEARVRATELLTSGAARESLERIIDAQGRRVPAIAPGTFVEPIFADRSGEVTEISGGILSGIARSAGAPNDPRAGLDLMCRIGDKVGVGDILYKVHAGSARNIASAVYLAKQGIGYVLSD